MLPGMKTTRHIAAAVTVLALGVLATVALASGGEPERQPTLDPAASVKATPTAEARREAVHHHRGRKARRHTATTTTHIHRGRGRDDAPSGAITSGRREAEPNDDRGREAEPNDDRGGRGEVEAGDDSGGRGGGDD